MYCPSCGSEQIQGLRYCNRCGANLMSDNAPPPKLGIMVWAVSLATILVGLGGLAMSFIFAMEVTGRRDSSTRDLLLVILFLLATVVISTLLIRQLSRLLSVYLRSGEKQRPAQIASSQPLSSQLPEMRENFISAAEQTTRRLDPADKKGSR